MTKMIYGHIGTGDESCFNGLRAFNDFTNKPKEHYAEQAKLAEQDKALDRQEGGKHYKDMAIQPFEYIHKNGIGFAEGCVIKYVTRWKHKGGVEDLRKARHFLDLLIEAEQA